MTTQAGSHKHGLIERVFPERRIFIRSDEETRYIRVRPVTQLIAWAGSFLVLSWTIIASAVLLMDNIGSGSIRDQAEREQAIYETRLSEIAAERDRQILLTGEAQERFATALGQISRLQSDLLASDARRREVETGMEAVQDSLRAAIIDRDTVRAQADQLLADASRGLEDVRTDAAHVSDLEETLAYLSDTLSGIADQTSATRAEAQTAEQYAADLKRDLELMEERNQRIFSQLEDAVANSLEPLGKMFSSVKLPTDRIIDQLRQTYTGQGGGPLSPISFPAEEGIVDQDTVRANAVMGRLDELALYRIAAQQIPFGVPVVAAVRSTSGFGYRTDPLNGTRKLHKGQDWAGSYGTTVLATADGTVVKAGWGSGYGRVIEIRHANGFETRYAHLSKITVTVGQKVSRGEPIGAMGNSGRSTGTHLHYEVRRNGEAVNPMTYIKAARDVF